MAKRFMVVTCVLLLAYFLFTSGLVFEAVGSETIDKVDMPYSVALSDDRIGVLEVANEDDVACARWLAEDRFSETSAILFMDVWSTYYRGEQDWVEWWNNDVAHCTATKIIPLLEWARQERLPVVFIDGDNVGLVPAMEAGRHGGLVTNSADEFDAWLKERGIKTVFYAGYAVNGCILERDTGMRAMSALGYNTVLIEDCSLPAPDWPYDGEAALAEIWNELGGIVSSEELEKMADGDFQIFADYNGVRLMLDYYDEFQKLSPNEPPYKHYLFFTSWNTTHKKMVFCPTAALRYYTPLHSLEGAVKLYWKGDAVVYLAP